MNTVVEPDPVKKFEFVAKLRNMYGTIDGVEIIPQDFLASLEDIAKRNYIVLEHNPDDRVARYRARAIKDYTDWLEKYQKSTNPTQP